MLVGVFILFQIGGIITINSVYGGSYPEQPIVIVNPWGTGGTTDNILIVMRTFGDKYFGKPIILSLKTGASAGIGHKFVEDSKPDGYNLIFTTMGPRVVAPHYREVNYDSLKGFTNICRIAAISDTFAVRADFPAKDFKEFIDYAKKNPGKVKVAQVGTEGFGYLAYKLLAKEAKLDMINVPFQSAGEPIIACAGGKVDAVLSSQSSLRAMVEAGKLRAIASTGSLTPSLYPHAKPFKEWGINAVLDDSYGISGPAKLPLEIVNFLQTKFKEMLQDPQVIQSFERIGVPLAYLGSNDFTRVIEEDFIKYKKLIKGE